MNKDKLKQCPFCGGEPKLETIPIDFAYAMHEMYFVRCLKCGSQIRKTDKRDKAIDLWNRRVGDEK